MLPFFLSLAVAGLPYAHALDLGESPVLGRGEGFLRAAITAHEGAAAFRSARRQITVNLTELPDTSYTIDLQIGTPPQKITVMLDTGSSDLWVNPICSTAGTAASVSSCSKLAQFQWTQSSTLKILSSETQLSYVKGAVLVEYVSDMVTIGSATIKNQIFGVALQSSDLSIGFLGLAPPLRGNGVYPYVFDSLASQGLIASLAFSLDLKAAGDPTGAIIFGGLDTKKFIGALEKRPILPTSQTPNGLNGYWISLTGIGITTSDGVSHASSAIAEAVFLDSGSTVTSLPTGAFLALGEALPGARYDQASGFFVLDCSTVSPDTTVDFTFGGKVIHVPYPDMIWKSGDQCYLLIQQSTSGIPVLGSSFLHSAYVVFDFDNGNFHIAQAANCGTNVISIGKGADSVPSSTGQCTVPTSAAGTATTTVSLDVTDTVSPTAIYTGTPVPTTEFQQHGPQLSATSVPGSSLPTVCSTCGNFTGTGTLSSPTSTSSSGSDSVRAVEMGTFAAMLLGVLGLWGL